MITHDDRQAEQAAAYAIGTLDTAEHAAFEQHLATCALCATDVRAYRDVAARLARDFSAEQAVPAAPSPALRARIVAAARVSAQPEPAKLDAFRPGSAPEAEGRVHPIRPRTATASIRAVAPTPRIASRTPWLAAAAALLVAAGLGAGWAHERAERVREAGEAALAVREATTLADSRQRSDAALRRSVAERDTLLAALTAPDVRVARLAASRGEPTRDEPGGVRLTWSPARGVIVLTASTMPQPHAGRTYQLWGLRRGTPQSLGVFAPEGDGRVRAVLRIPPRAEMEVVAVTEEPSGGSGRPTAAALMTGGLGR